MTTKRDRPVPEPDAAAQAEAKAYLAATRPGTPGWLDAQRNAIHPWTPEEHAAVAAMRGQFPAVAPPRDTTRQTVCTRHRFDVKAGVVRAVSRRYAQSPCNGTTHAKQLTWW